MVIALLAVLGVDLIVIVVLLGVMLTRRRWVSHQPDAFKGAIRVVDGAVAGLGSKWQRGYGRWVRDVLVWTKAPFLLRNELVAVDGLGDAVRAAEPGEVKRLGSDPVIVPLAADGGARVEVATAADNRERALAFLTAVNIDGTTSMRLKRERDRWFLDPRIPVEEQTAIFARFRRGSSHKRTEGAGLGLAIVKVIAEAHHGRVLLDSAPGAGSTFTIVLPVDQPTEAERNRR